MLKFINTPKSVALCFLITTAHIKATFFEGHSFFIKMTRLFGASSSRRLAKMSLNEKNEELRFYAQKEFQKPRLLSWTSCVFDPKNQYFDEIIYLIQHGASPNYNVPYYWTNKVSGQGYFKPIYLFIQSNDIERTRLLLELGARVDLPVLKSRNHKMYALTFAKTKEMAELLLSYGAVINFVITPCDTSLPFLEQKLISSLVRADYQAELLPLYFSYYEKSASVDSLNNVAQSIWEHLKSEKWSYKNSRNIDKWPQLITQFHKKKQYLRDAGATIDTSWDDTSWVWSIHN